MGVITRPRDANDPFYRSTSSDYTHAYHQIVKAARSGRGGPSTSASLSSGAGPVLMLVSTDVDSICAARILVSLLTDDDIPYKMCPVDGYTTLSRIVKDDVETNSELHTIVMLNLGSILSLPDFFTSASNPVAGSQVLPDGCHIHLIDSHRPYNLDNLFATSTVNQRLHVWDDGEIEERLGREEKAYTALELLDEDETSEEESEDEVDDGNASDGSEGSRKKRRRKDNGRKRLPPNVIAGHRKVLTRYYKRGAQYGMSVAGVMFILGERLGRSSNDSLWMAILGLTSQYSSSQIAHGLYNDLSRSLAADVRALNPPASKRANGPSDNGTIRVVEKELRFTLYRHWSLEAAMYHSPYVAGKMGTWREKGMSKLRSFLAKMGLSLPQCRQAFEHMDLDLRKTLISRIESIAPEYEMTECIYRSFIRSHGFRAAAMSAADVVEGLEALLCAAYGARIEVDAPGLAFGGVAAGIDDAQGAYMAAMSGQTQRSDMFTSKKLWQLANCGGAADSRASNFSRSMSDKENTAPTTLQDDDEEDDRHSASFKPNTGDGAGDAQKTTSRDEAHWVRNFFAAFTALDTIRPENLSMLKASLNLSKALHDVIVRQGVTIIEKQMIRSVRNFRFVLLTEGNDLPLFHNTQLLTKLGFWLVDALRDLVELTVQVSRRKEGGKEVDDPDDEARLPQALPFVIAALNEKEDTYSVVGINASMQYGDVLRNNFGFGFHQAIQESNCRSKHDSFETSAVEIRREDFPIFIEALHGVL